MLRLLFTLCLGLMGHVMFAQSKTITGIAMDDSDDPENSGLFHVEVFVKGSNNYAFTDVDGSFSIEANLGDTLVFRSIGFKDFETKIENLDPLKVFLKEESFNLDEVIVK